MDAPDNTTQTADLTRRLAGPMYQGRIWLQLVGVMMLIYGALTAITIVGLLVAWLPIWMGVLLFQIAGALDLAFTVGDDEAMLRAQRKLKTYFTIMGVLTLIGILFTIVSMLVGGMGVMMGAGHMSGM